MRLYCWVVEFNAVSILVEVSPTDEIKDAPGKSVVMFKLKLLASE